MQQKASRKPRITSKMEDKEAQEDSMRKKKEEDQDEVAALIEINLGN